MLTRGWQDAAHYQSLRTVTPLQPGTWYIVTVPIDAHDDLLATGHVLGLVLTLSDEEYPSPTRTGATVTIDLGHSSLLLPVTGSGLAASPAATETFGRTGGAAPVLVDRSRPFLG